MILPASNAGIEIGSNTATNTPFIDFHTQNRASDYDVRLIATGGGAGDGLGTLSIQAANVSAGTFTATTFSGALSGNASTASAVAMSSARTDSTAYPAVWGTTGSTSQLYSCSAVTIQSSTGTLTATTLSGQLAASTQAASINWTGVNYFVSNKGATSTVGANNSYSLEAYATDGGAAGMSFHRSGAFAINMGLDPDNIFRIGGWSASANRLQLDMSGNGQMTYAVVVYDPAPAILYITANWQEWANVGSVFSLLNKTDHLQGVSRIEVPLTFETQQHGTVTVIESQTIVCTVDEEEDVILVVPV